MAKEFNFRTHPEESILFFDIETVRGSKELVQGTHEYDAFKYKMRHSEEAKAKDFNFAYIEALYKEKAALYPEFGKIVCVSMGVIRNGNKMLIGSIKGHDERELLLKLDAKVNSMVAKDNMFALCGLNIKVFDLRFIFVRCLANGIQPILGQFDFTGLKPWEINVFDLTDNWKQGSFYNAPMIAITYCLGLPSPKDDIDGSQVSDIYYNEGDEGLEKIAKYCEKDVLQTANIFRKLRGGELLSLPEEGEVIEEDVAQEELPVLMQLKNKKELDDDIKEKLKASISKKPTKADRENLKRIFLANYLTVGDKVAEKKRKEKEINEFVETL